MGGKRQQDFVDKYDVLKVVYDALAVQEVHGRCEPVPVEAFGGAQGSGLAGNIGDGDDLFEGDDLNCGNDQDDVDVSHKQGAEEDGDHDKCP